MIPVQQNNGWDVRLLQKIQRFLRLLPRKKHKIIRRGKWIYSFLRSHLEGVNRLPSGKRVIFLLSTGRTGTTFLGTVLNEIPSVVSRHEPQPDCFDLGVMRSEDRCSYEWTRRLVKANRWWVPKLLREENARTYFESNQYLFSLIPILGEIFPKSKFIRVVRDGRDVVRSMFVRGLYEPVSKYDYPRPDRIEDDPWGSEWNEMSRFERITWYWQFKDRYIRDALREVPESRRLNLKFEKIYKASEGYPGMVSLMDFVGVEDVDWRDWMSQKVRSTTEHELPPWPQWSRERRDRFDRIAGAHLRRCGYRWD